MDFLTLDIGGIALAIILGTMFVALGLGIGYFFLLTMIVFLMLSAIVTWIGIRYKRRLGIGQSPRGIKNVLANGIPPMIMVIIFYIASNSGNTTLALFSVFGFLASVAAITADKFSSEIGVLNGMPRMIFTMKRVKKGTSGGISPLGLFAGLVASFLIALLILSVPSQLSLLSASPVSAVKAVVGITLAGFVGNLVDSVLGYYEEKGIGNKFSSNFVCGIFAGILAIVLFVLL